MRQIILWSGPYAEYIINVSTPHEDTVNKGVAGLEDLDIKDPSGDPMGIPTSEGRVYNK